MIKLGYFPNLQKASREEIINYINQHNKETAGEIVGMYVEIWKKQGFDLTHPDNAPILFHLYNSGVSYKGSIPKIPYWGYGTNSTLYYYQEQLKDPKYKIIQKPNDFVYFKERTKKNFEGYLYFIEKYGSDNMKKQFMEKGTLPETPNDNIWFEKAKDNKILIFSKKFYDEIPKRYHKPKETDNALIRINNF
jgi:hypothetical protein